MVEGRRLLNFCSNDYLGLANHPCITSAAKRAMDDYGLGAGAAGLLSGWSDAHQALAENLADFLHRDRALIFSSGYLANLATLTTFSTRHTEIFHDRLNHASLIDGVQLSGARSNRYRHTDLLDLSTRLSQSQAAEKLLVTDTVFSMDGDLAPLEGLAALARQHQALFICDDAHGFGVLARGRGAVEAASLSQDDVPLVMVTFGKALGVAGAAVVGRSDLIEQLLQGGRTFIYDTAIPPALAVASNAALDLLRREPGLVSTLDANIECFTAALAAAGLPATGSATAIQPVVLGDDATALLASSALRDAGFYVRAVRPPTVPVGTARLRICLSAAHTPQQIKSLASALSDVLARLKPA